MNYVVFFHQLFYVFNAFFNVLVSPMMVITMMVIICEVAMVRVKTNWVKTKGIGPVVFNLFRQ